MKIVSAKCENKWWPIWFLFNQVYKCLFYFFSLVPSRLTSNMVVLQVLKDFAGATSIHGLGFIVNTRLSIFERVAWSLIFTAAIMWASIQLQFAVTSKLRVEFLKIRLRHKSLLIFGFLYIGILILIIQCNIADVCDLMNNCTITKHLQPYKVQIF